MNPPQKDPPGDAFAELGLPRRLALDPEAIENAWRQRSRDLHPDGAGGDAGQAAGANGARDILRTPASRLRHWLELHGNPLAGPTGLDPGLMSLFAEAGPLFHEAEDISRRKSAATTALAKALLAAPGFAVQKKLQDLMRRIRKESESVTDRFEVFQATAAAGDFREANQAAGRLVFLEKWQGQCRERLLALIVGD